MLPLYHSVWDQVMIRSVITKIDCGDWCCNACKWLEHDILTNTDTCQLFNQQVFDSPTFSSEGHLERCDECKKAEIQTDPEPDKDRENVRICALCDAELKPGEKRICSECVDESF